MKNSFPIALLIVALGFIALATGFAIFGVYMAAALLTLFLVVLLCAFIYLISLGVYTGFGWLRDDYVSGRHMPPLYGAFFMSTYDQDQMRKQALRTKEAPSATSTGPSWAKS